MNDLLTLLRNRDRAVSVLDLMRERQAQRRRVTMMLIALARRGR